MDLNSFGSFPAGKYKKRQLKQLTANHRIEILHSYLIEFKPQKDVAKEYRVSPSLVGRLARDFKSKPQMLDKLREGEISKSLMNEAIMDQTSAMLAKSIPITHAGKI